MIVKWRNIYPTTVKLTLTFFYLFLSQNEKKSKRPLSVIAQVRYVFSKWPISKGEEFVGNSEKKDATA